MPIFNLKSENLSQIKEMPFKLEREIQSLVERNLDILLGFELVKSEFTISGTVQQLRIHLLLTQEVRRLLLLSTSRIKISVSLIKAMRISPSCSIIKPILFSNTMKVAIRP